MSVATAATTLPRQRKAAVRNTAEQRRARRTAFAFLAPSLIGVVLFLLIPIIMVIGLSLVQWNMITPMKWVGLGQPRHRRRADRDRERSRPGLAGHRTGEHRAADRPE